MGRYEGRHRSESKQSVKSEFKFSRPRVVDSTVYQTVTHRASGDKRTVKVHEVNLHNRDTLRLLFGIYK